jgi:hypothetical protein
MNNPNPSFTGGRMIGLGDELLEDRLDLRVVGGNRAALAEIAGGARERHVVDGRFPTSGRWNKVIEVEDAACCVEVLEDSPRRDFSSRGSQGTVMADATVALRNFVTHLGGNVFAIRHAVRVAYRSVELPTEVLQIPVVSEWREIVGVA